MSEFLPHYRTHAFSRLHVELADDLTGLHLARGSWLVREAPRGSAKTTFATKAYTLWAVCEGVEPYTLLLSDTGDQAKTFLDAIKQELDGNAALASAYPDACGAGPVWQSSRVRLRNGCAIEVRGSGGRIRGLTSRSRRPSLVIVDDANEKADAYSSTLRSRRWEWFTKDVMAVGTPETNVVVLGTPIHRETICRRLRGLPGWRHKGYRSVIAWPDRMELWQEWERLLTDLANEERDTTARAFYDANREEMDRGAVVLWPDRYSLYDLMRWRAASGERAFASEYQDEPGADGATEWPADYFEGPDFWFSDWPDLLYRVQALDPSKGTGAKPGDWQAHVMLGLGRNGHLYFDADLRREPVTDMVARALAIARQFRPMALVFEDNGTMGLLQPEIARQSGSAGFACAWETVTNSIPKLARIRTVGPYLSRKQVHVRNSVGGRLLVDQWRDVPGGEFDDGADAAGTCVMRLGKLVP